ncbi:MAG: sugar ABC transporter permease [Bacilli bacterium]|jgi:ABC-type sugar transport system permease subunit|nr:sugar ABC transporter permease [Bacilli bacterium]
MNENALARSPQKRKKSKWFTHEAITAYLWLLFPIFWWGVFFLFAFVRGVVFSFTDLTISISKISKFTFEQYNRLFADEVFWTALRNTIIWTLVMTVLNNGLGLFVAYLISRIHHGQKVWLTLLFWPTLVSAVVSSQITTLIFDPSDTGIMNQIIMAFGGTPLAWYNDPNLSLFTLMIIPALLGFSSQMLIYYVAIEGIPKSYVEAAIMDGASTWQIFKHIYVPSINGAILYNCLLSIIGGLQVIGPMQLITNGGPLDSSMSITLYMYNSLIGGENGYACAIAVVTLVLIVLLSALQIWMQHRASHSEKAL